MHKRMPIILADFLFVDVKRGDVYVQCRVVSEQQQLLIEVSTAY
jgi:hypothetical protein